MLTGRIAINSDYVDNLAYISKLHLIVLQWLISFLNGSEMLVSQQVFQFGKLSLGKILGLIDLGSDRPCGRSFLGLHHIFLPTHCVCDKISQTPYEVYNKNSPTLEVWQ